MPQTIERLPYVLRFQVVSPPSNFIHSWEVLSTQGQVIFKIVTNLPQRNGHNHAVTPMPMTYVCSKRGVLAQIDWHNPSGTSIQIGSSQDITNTTRLPPETAQALVVPAPSRWQLLSNWAKSVLEPKNRTCGWEVEMKILLRREHCQNHHWRTIPLQFGVVGNDIIIWNFDETGNGHRYKPVAKIINKVPDLLSNFELWVYHPRLLSQNDVFKALIVAVVIVKSRRACTPSLQFFGD